MRQRVAAIEALSDATTMDEDTGAVRSVQRADLMIDREALAGTGASSRARRSG
jgi:hypothetical protein